MVHLVDNPNMKTKEVITPLTTGEIREITKAVSKMIGIVVSELPEEVILLLQHYGVQASNKTSEKDIIRALYEKISHNDEQFNLDLEVLILASFPELSNNSGSFVKCNFSSFFGKNSSDSKLVQGVTKIGTSTTSGAAGGGIVGAALGAVSGIFGFANSAKLEKIEKEKASAMTLSSMLQYKSAQLGSKGQSQRNLTTIIIAIIALVGIIVTIVFIKNKQKAKVWKVEKA